MTERHRRAALIGAVIALTTVAAHAADRVVLGEYFTNLL